jgi:tetratricopeptide (TPR) repeat protein
MDREIGRLLAALPGGAERWLIAAVGDHGESLGEHGEPNHGIFLYHATVHVPLLLAGPGVPRGKAVADAVATRRLAATLLHLTGSGRATPAFGPGLPGLPGSPALPGLASGAPSPVYLASRYPLTGYGWSPLEGMFDGRFKLIVAPRPELYDLAADPGETHNLLDAQREPARRLQQALAAARRSFQVHPADAADPELARSLQSLGYLSGSGTSGNGKGTTLDPKDGVPMLAELAAARDLAGQKSWRPAVAKLTELVRRSPGSVAFLTQLAAAQLDSGLGDAAIVTYRRALRENPKRDESHRLLADAYARRGRGEEARQEYELTLTLNPRSFPAWRGLADLAEKEGRPAEVRSVLTRAVAAGTESVSLLERLAKIEAAAGDAAAAERHSAAARRLYPP